ncbi:helix-turn-helix transcriptional regulator [Gracilibacillus thailandensis]|uniref:Helix-turn-helix domain-containing protein n=1 Tax=Gracilibacillus thailandensis TaxID=563735 RepID=A0A6N7QSU6_9BACI|nr:helix-turn-helix transcriptional regulator [Gracilibacillus thailandensis]MRI65113.1 helix-turn-helix domain-containing protein [Gracilibacillus thailandensis]
MELEIGNLLRKMRLKARLTQAQLAEKMGMARTTVSKLENGVYTVAAADLFRWSKTTNGQDQLIAFMHNAQIIGDTITSMPTVVSFISPLLPFVA